MTAEDRQALTPTELDDADLKAIRDAVAPDSAVQLNRLMPAEREQGKAESRARDY